MKILLVCCEYKITDSLKKGLEEKGHLVTNAFEKTLLEGDVSFDLIIMDEFIPIAQTAGFNHLLSRIKQTTPILTLVEIRQLGESIKPGSVSNSYLEKPFEFTELLNRIEHIGKPLLHFEQNRLLILDDLIMDVDERTVKRGKDNVALTSKEFDLLKYMFHKVGKLTTLSELAGNIWKIDFELNESTVRTYMDYLCDKIDRNYGRKLIHKVSRLEYMLSAEAPK